MSGARGGGGGGRNGRDVVLRSKTLDAGTEIHLEILPSHVAELQRLRSRSHARLTIVIYLLT